ncbi:MAG: EamA family transporter [Planctomycetes bacterium]|nr:EamA family transporter [Planctomycetota bacterium]
MDTRAIIFIIIAIFGWGIAAVFDKMALKTGDSFSGLTIRAAVVFVTMALLAVFSGKSQSIITLVRSDMRSTLYFAASGILAGFIAMVAYYAALRLAPSSQVVPISSAYPLVTALFAMFLLKETVSVQQWLGILLIMIGIYLVQVKPTT